MSALMMRHFRDSNNLSVVLIDGNSEPMSVLVLLSVLLSSTHALEGNEPTKGSSSRSYDKTHLSN